MERDISNTIFRLGFFSAIGIVLIQAVLSVAPLMFRLTEGRPGCDTPIHWRLGDVDSRFPVDRKTFLLTAIEAGNVWEKRIGKKMFIYDPQTSFAVTTVFDDRQKMLYDSQGLEKTVAQYQKDAAVLKNTYDTLQAGFKRDQTVLNDRIASYQKALAVYNDDVSQANAAGGATPDKYASLEKRRKELEKEQSVIKKETDRISMEVDQVNAAAGKINTKTTSVKNDIQTYRQKYGEPQPFIEGLFESPLRSITIYEFKGVDDLRLVIAHEFGHALGIAQHAPDDQSAIMYAMMGGQDLLHPGLTEADIKAYEAVCPASAVSPRDAFVSYLVDTPYPEMKLGTIFTLFSTLVTSAILVR